MGYMLKKKTRIGPWETISPLGEGGNGEVWKARHDDGSLGAIKILRATPPERYERFKAEIEIQSRLSDRKGILPLIDAEMPNQLSKGNFAWLVTPVAIKLDEHLVNADPESVVQAISDIADTLAGLAEKDISHRDIKPDNLFWLDDGPVIGDFGLADFPEKNALTKPGEKLGPMYYMAPEMLTDAKNADGRLADVYSLAKTLWVIATGQRYPPPGEQRTDVHQVQLSAYVVYPRAYLINRLLERATRHDPSRRPSMRQVVEELNAWRALIQGGDSTLPNLTSVGPKIEAAVAPLQRAEQRKLEQINQAQAELERLSERMKVIAKPVADFAPCNGEIGYGRKIQANCPQQKDSGPKVPPDIVILNQSSPYFLVICPDSRRIQLVCGIGMDLLEDGRLHVAAAYILEVLDKGDVIWCEQIEAPVGTAKCEKAADALLDKFSQNLPWALEKFADAVKESCR